MRNEVRVPILVLGLYLLLNLVMPAAAQQIRFEDFSSTANIQMNGSAHQATWQGAYVLRLTDGPVHANTPETSTAYFRIQQPLTYGFTTWFEFQTHNPTLCCTPGDGIAFIIQNSSATDPTYGASGSQLTALGAGYGGMGYAGVNNNLAVEFDIYGNAWDPNPNHVAIQSCGPNTNTPVHLPGQYTIGSNHNVTSCLLSAGAINTSIPMIGGTCGEGSCQDGPVHNVVIQYIAPANGQSYGTLEVWLDPVFIPGTHTPKPNSPPVLNVPYNIVYSANNPTGLRLFPQNGGAWVGFTASQPIQGTAQDILGWEFTPAVPTLVTKVIQNGGTPTIFPFGAHEMQVTYPLGFMNPQNITMSVLATPTDQNTFYQQRLLGTQFANEACARYLGTGTNTCIVYSVTCQLNGQNITCPSEEEPTIEIDSSFYTSDPISPTNADFLEAEPIGSNNWFSIFTSYSNDPLDGTVSGLGKGFSDIVTTFQRNKP